MVYNRTGYAPWSLTRAAGVQSATVDGTIEVPQYIQPTLDTGFVDERGNWKGIKSSDEVFTIDAPHLATPNSASVLSPQTANRSFIDMTGFQSLMIALQVTNAGNYETVAVMGPDTNPFANLTPVNAAVGLKGTGFGDPSDRSFEYLCFDDAENLTADVWNIFYVKDRLAGQKNMQFKITNNSGGNSDITFAYLRMV